MKKRIILLLTLLLIIGSVGTGLYLYKTGYFLEEKDIVTNIDFINNEFRLDNAVIYNDSPVSGLVELTSDNSIEYDNTNAYIKVNNETINKGERAKILSQKFTFLGQPINQDWTREIKINKDKISFSNGINEVLITLYSDTPYFLPEQIRCNRAITYNTTGSDGNYLMLARNMSFQVYAQNEDYLKDLFHETDTYYTQLEEYNKDESSVLVNIPSTEFDSSEDMIDFEFDETFPNYQEEREYINMVVTNAGHPEFANQPIKSLPWFPETNHNYGVIALTQNKQAIQPYSCGDKNKGFNAFAPDDAINYNCPGPEYQLDLKNEKAYYELIIPSIKMVRPVFGPIWSMEGDAFGFLGSGLDNSKLIKEKYGLSVEILDIYGHGDAKSSAEPYHYHGMDATYDTNEGDLAYLFNQDGTVNVYDYYDRQYYVVQPEVNPAVCALYDENFNFYKNETVFLKELYEKYGKSIMLTGNCNHEDFLPEDIREETLHHVYWLKIN